MEAMEVDVEHGTHAEIVSSVEGKLRFHGENDDVVRVLQEQLLLLEHLEVEIRREALVCVASHLDLTRDVKTRREIVHALKVQLWREEDSFLVQSVVKVLVDVALLPLCTSSLAISASVRHQLCACVKEISGDAFVCESCAKSADVQTRDGLVSSTTSPLKREAHDSLDLNSSGEKWISRVEGHVDNKFAVAKSVAQLLHTYLATKDLVELGLKSAVRLQIMHSLLKIGEKTDGIVTWESLGFVVRRHLRSSNPRVRALVLRLLVESVQERNLVMSGNVGEVEPESVKRRRVGDYCPVESLEAPTIGSTCLEMKSADHLQDLVDNSAKNELIQQGVSGGSPGFGMSRLKAGEILLPSLLNYMRDPYPSVREAALRALMKLHTKGYELTNDCCKTATNIFRDSFGYVRIAAIEMVGLWMRSYVDLKDGSSSKQLTEAFLQVCTTVTDMNMRVREAAFRVLGEATRIPESVLLQTLTKKVAKAPKEKNVSVSVSPIAQDDDTETSKSDEGSNLLDASAAGAFVHGLEDEYLEVRCVAIEALAKLACKCERMVFGAANLLLDMLNEEVEVVRMQAMHALSQLATAGYLSVHDQHLHLFLSVVEDTSPEMRKGGCNLLSSSQLPSFSTFHSIVCALLTSLERHPEDEGVVTSTFSVLGQIHPTYTECIVQELLQEMHGYLNEEVGLDEPRFAAILSLFLGAGLSKPNIVSLIPARILSYANLISHKLPNSLPLIKLWPVGLKSVQFSWSTGEKSQIRAHVRSGHRALHVSNPVARRHNL